MLFRSRARIDTYVPQSSIVGVLLEHDGDYRIVKSDAKGLAQHDAHSWQVLGTDFEYATERTAFGVRTEQILDRFINGFSPERKRLFTEALFTVLEGTQEQTLSGILANKSKSIKNAMRSFANLEPAVRDVLIETISALAEAGKNVRREDKKRLAMLDQTAKAE